MLKFCIIVSLLLMLIGCTSITKREIARQKAEIFLDNIADGKAKHEFPQKYPQEKVDFLLSMLKDSCHFKNRQGQFVNDWYESNTGGVDRVSLIYEYYLKCDDIRIILTYELGDSIVLANFWAEGLMADNPMIVDRTRQLKRRK